MFALNNLSGRLSTMMKIRMKQNADTLKGMAEVIREIL
jgi:hypothetical protein